jgi:hypothetical protein
MIAAMTTLLRAMLIAGVIVAVPGLAVSGSDERHSGTVVSIDRATRTLVLQELVENGRLRPLEVRVPAAAAIVYSERIPDEQVTRLDAPFVDHRVDLGEVHPGDFVVIEGAVRGGVATASIVVVTLRAGAAAAVPAAAAAGATTRR